MKVTPLVIFTAIVLLVSPFGGGAVQAEKTGRITPKVMVFTMFEIGENTGDRAGEFQHWFEAYFSHAQSLEVKGAFAPVFVNEEGVCGTIIGQGKSHAAASVTAILKDPRFDFSSTYFLTSGCSGAPPAFASPGSVVWADYVVDYDLGHRIASPELEGGQDRFIPMHAYDAFTSFRLNAGLVRWAYALSRDIELTDSEKARAYRSNYPQPNARRAPRVTIGTTICGDCYFHGSVLSRQAAAICRLYGAGEYGTTEMEDAAVAFVLKNFGYLDRYAVSRDVVNFDQPYPGQTAVESLKADSGGFSIGMENGFSAGAALVNHIIAHWEAWKNGVPDRAE